jgi:hypothetical protein
MQSNRLNRRRVHFSREMPVRRDRLAEVRKGFLDASVQALKHPGIGIAIG